MKPENTKTAISHEVATSRLIKTIVALALPMAGSRLIQMLSTFIGMLMLAKLGNSVLAASMLMSSTQPTIIMIFMSFLFSISIVVGQAFGGKQQAKIGLIFQQGSLFALLLSVPLVILFLYVDRALLALGQLPELVMYVKEYFHALVWGVPGFMLLTAFQQTLYGMRNQHLVIVSNLCCLLIFVFSAYVLIFGHFGFPALGVAGLGYAFSVQSYFNIIILFLAFSSKKEWFVTLFKKSSFKNLNYLKQLFQIGWPISLQFSGELLGLSMIAVMIGWLGKDALAVSQATQQCLFLCIVPMFAIAEATGIIVSETVGGKRYHLVKRMGDSCLILATILALFIGILLIAFSNILTSLYFSPSLPYYSAILHLMRTLFILFAFNLVFNTWRDVATGALRGLYDTRVPMWVGLTSVWIIAVGGGYLLGIVFHYGVIGFRIASGIAFLIGGLLMLWRWQIRTKALA